MNRVERPKLIDNPVAYLFVAALSLAKAYLHLYKPAKEHKPENWLIKSLSLVGVALTALGLDRLTRQDSVSDYLELPKQSPNS